uniref:zinc metalloproteinase nas-15 n=1 Tax=Ciona intestinalis TaxID=7719 RepID=UPI0000521289|nr:zinc metalloproteinase nas-15 [Ciona intestinalis]|eukprot:XP_026691970.1 zinc metalloproteinase nas-15 [Ciona intestinalis]
MMLHITSYVLLLDLFIGHHLAFAQTEKECNDVVLQQGQNYPLEVINACAQRRLRQNSPSGALNSPCTAEPDCGVETCVFGFRKDASGCRVSCQCSDGEGLYEGDIELTDLTKTFLLKNVDTGVPTPAPTYDPLVQHAAGRSIRLWNNIREGNNFVVPYAVSRGIGSSGRAAIAAAVRDFDANTCIRLRPSTRYSGRPYLYMYPGGGCSSPVGRQSSRQQVSLASGCWQKGTVIHEILHSLGFWHEQSRPDRDSHVRINTANIFRGMAYNFNKMSNRQINSRNSPYDIGSVMHYNSYAFSSNRRPTITDLQGRPITTQRNGFSRQDLIQLNAMYGCTTTGTGGGGTGTGGGGTGTGGGGTGTGGGGTGTGGGGGAAAAAAAAGKLRRQKFFVLFMGSKWRVQKQPEVHAPKLL